MPKAARISSLLLAALLLLLSFAPALAKGAPDANAVRERFVALLQKRQFAALETAMDRLQQDYDQRKIPDWHFDVAYRAFQPQEWDAEAALNDWVRASPKAYQPYVARGLFHAVRGSFARGDAWNDEERSGEQLAAMRIAYESAIGDLQRAVRIQPRLQIAWVALINIAGDLDDGGELQHNLRAGLAALPNSIWIRWAFANALHYREAERELEAFIAETQQSVPKSDPGYRGIGTWSDNFEAYRLLREREYHSAVLVFSRAIARDDRSRLRVGRAAAEFEAGNREAAIADLRTALKMRPSDDDALSRLAEILWEKDQRLEAETLIRQAIALSPMYPGYRLLRAYMRFESARDAEALADLDLAQVFGRYDARVHHLRGEILTKTDPAAALRALDVARRLSPDSAPIQLSYVEALHRAADCRAPDALAAYERMCVEAQSCNARASQLRAMIEDAPCQSMR
jgi:tetratricopeptide (TPR) repeat protein